MGFLTWVLINRAHRCINKGNPSFAWIKKEFLHWHPAPTGSQLPLAPSTHWHPAPSAPEMAPTLHQKLAPSLHQHPAPSFHQNLAPSLHRHPAPSLHQNLAPSLHRHPLCTRIWHPLCQ